MRHLLNLGLKFLLITSVVFVILQLLYGVDFGTVLLISATLTLVSYFAGDLLILPKTNNLTASSADFGLSLITIWLMGVLLVGNPYYPSLTAALITSVIITVTEYGFHIYMGIIDSGEPGQAAGQTKRDFSFEASEELLPDQKAGSNADSHKKK
ncbi:DUF2512 family protein [Mesobacillus harenae]|uniref:DUF2512 family protein n=1 Tax=Mesobacillus harenae TaxID=2213203 RepID=UPI0015807668|nr:DUF2512 family protein [Mesobacillus harenae]